MKAVQKIADRVVKRRKKAAAKARPLTHADYPILCIDPGKKSGYCYVEIPGGKCRIVKELDFSIKPRSVICERSFIAHQSGVGEKIFRAGMQLGTAVGIYNAVPFRISVAAHRQAFGLPVTLPKEITHNRIRAHHMDLAWSVDPDQMDAQIIAYAVGKGAPCEVYS